MTRTPGTYAVFETSEGTIVCRLFEKDAPKTVANFVDLAKASASGPIPRPARKPQIPFTTGPSFIA